MIADRRALLVSFIGSAKVVLCAYCCQPITDDQPCTLCTRTPMDPDANLAEQLRLAARITYQLENDKPVSENDTSRLADLVLALDEWIAKGGFLPKRYQRKP